MLKSPRAWRFERFILDPTDRSLRRDGAPVEISARYLDALALLVGEAGRMVSKDRFLSEVWRGVPVTDEALTQCVRALRRALGDEAARPRFIETVPKHGYRFIAPVEALDAAPEARWTSPPPADGRWALASGMTRAGMLGGGAAGVVGGLIYGATAVGQSEGAGVSALAVIAALTAVVGLLGGLGVAGGMAAARLAGERRAWRVAGAGAGGLLIGGLVNLLGLDAFALLFGQAPVRITGAAEGLALGLAVGLAAVLAERGPTPGARRRVAALGALTTGAAGVGIALTGGRLMGGSLDAVADRFAQSRLNLDGLGALTGETGFGPLAQAVTAGLEGALFGACVVAALNLGLDRGRAPRPEISP